MVPLAGVDPGIFDRRVPGFSRKCEVKGEFLEVDGSSCYKKHRASFTPCSG